MQEVNNEKDILLLEKRFVELSRTAYQRDIITYSDFLIRVFWRVWHGRASDVGIYS